MYRNSLDVHCESRQTRFIYRLFGTARGTISQQWRSISWRTNGYRHRMKICEFSCRLYRAWKCFFFLNDVWFNRSRVSFTLIIYIIKFVSIWNFIFLIWFLIFNFFIFNFFSLFSQRYKSCRIWIVSFFFV